MRKLIKSTTEYVSALGRRAQPIADPVVAEKLAHLKSRGFVMLDHLVGSSQFEKIKASLKQKIEHDIDVNLPCLSQSKIDPKRDKDLVDRNFLASDDEYHQRQLTFGRDDITSYKQMVKDFQPSTLTVPMPHDIDYYHLWLDPLVMDIVCGYMGFTPDLTEAYIRRNFPSKFRVMNFNWHRDTNHDKYLVKAFFFFTDCDIDTGAHHYIAGSIDDPRYRDKTYYTDDEINKTWPIGSADHMISTVKAGTIIIEDTRGLHKAGIPKKAYRDLGFAVFTPPNMFIKRAPYYTINRGTYDGLSGCQRGFIPKNNVTI